MLAGCVRGFLASCVLALVAGLIAPLAGCSTLPDRVSYRLEDLQGAHVVGFPADIRIWGDADVRTVQQALRARLAEERRGTAPTGSPMPPASMLALSGGGEDGAFGAGLLVGWTEHGNRPTFDIVTGVSTGSLIAPLAFVGSSQDQKLREAFTTIDKKNILLIQGIFTILTGESVATTAPLREMVAHFVTLNCCKPLPKRIMPAGGCTW